MSVAAWDTHGGHLLFPESTANEASASCNVALSVVHPAYAITKEPAGGYRCYACNETYTSDMTCGSDAPAEVPTSIHANATDPSHRDYCTNRPHIGWECLICNAGRKYSPTRPPASGTVHVSSNCNHVERGGIGALALRHTAHNLTVHGHGGVLEVPELPVRVGRNFTLTDVTVCPVYARPDSCHRLAPAESNGTYAPPWPAPEANLSEVALQVTHSGNITIDNVFAPTARALLSVRPLRGTSENVKVGSLNVSGGARAFVVALSHATVKTSAITCSVDDNRALVQTRQGSRAPGLDTSGCKPKLDLTEILSAYGAHYEIEFYHNGVARKTAGVAVELVTKALTYAVIVLAVLIVFAHEGDVRRIIRRRQK